MKVKKYIAEIQTKNRKIDYLIMAYSRSDAHIRLEVIVKGRDWKVLSIKEFVSQNEGVVN